MIDPASEAIVIHTKPAWQSVTLWLNILGAVAVIISIIVEANSLLELPDNVLAWLTVAMAIANTLLRILRTNAPIIGSPPAQAALHVTRNGA